MTRYLVAVQATLAVEIDALDAAEASDEIKAAFAPWLSTDPLGGIRIGPNNAVIKMCTIERDANPDVKII